ncbi:hypothetical protein [Salinibacterium sp. PAMC 21357]|nr:hypothetical protein [Salinibacterium sp. PAMC 21357]
MSDKKPAARREIRVAVAYLPIVNLLPPELASEKLLPVHEHEQFSLH